MNRISGYFMMGAVGVALFTLVILAFGAQYPHSIAYQIAKFLWSV